MVSSVQSGSGANPYQPSSSVSQGSSQPSSAALPQDTVTISDTFKDAQTGAKGTASGGPADVDHDGDSH